MRALEMAKERLTDEYPEEFVPMIAYEKTGRLPVRENLPVFSPNQPACA